MTSRTMLTLLIFPMNVEQHQVAAFLQTNAADLGVSLAHAVVSLCKLQGSHTGTEKSCNSSFDFTQTLERFELGHRC